MNRRAFLKSLSAFTVLSSLTKTAASSSQEKLLFKISLAEWSLHNTLFGDARQKLGWKRFKEELRKDTEATLTGEFTNLDFPRVARHHFGIDAVEYVNQFFLSEARNDKYLNELRNKAKAEGVTNVLIMVDLEGSLAASDAKERKTAVDNHQKWIDAAAFLGCHSVRVNTRGDGTFEEQMKHAADSLYRLAEYGDKNKINVIVENHGGYSSDPEWLVGVMKRVNHPRAGTLPDFGNFPEDADKYAAVRRLMPYAKGVSAKANKFDKEGQVVGIDYVKMMKIVVDAGYHGYVGIEFGGTKEEEYEGIRKIKALLEQCMDAI